jgi:hypothetical protein
VTDPNTGLPLDPNFSAHGPVPIVERHTHYRVTIDVGPHLSHLLKRLFSKRDQQGDVDALTDKLKVSGDELDVAVEDNTPRE